MHTVEASGFERIELLWCQVHHSFDAKHSEMYEVFAHDICEVAQVDQIFLYLARESTLADYCLCFALARVGNADQWILGLEGGAVVLKEEYF